MKKGFFSLMLLFCCTLVFNSCIKNTPYETTLDPYLTASIGTYNFTSKTVVPSTVDTQAHDSIVTLKITGNSSDLGYVNDQIILTISNYKEKITKYSIVQGEANAIYVHNGVADPAIGGIVAVTKITSNSLIGYFSFQTAAGTSVLDGAFSVGKPWYFY